MPHLIHAAVSLTSGTVFFVVAILLVSSSDWRSLATFTTMPDSECPLIVFGLAEVQ
jgi:hypothetical protein